MTRRLRLRFGGTTEGGTPVAAVVIALLIVYTVWGSTYYAIRVAIDTMPPWMVRRARLFAGERLHPLAAAGIGVGLAGVALLLRPGAGGGAAVVAMLALLVSPLGWAAGSLYARRARLPSRPLVATGME